MARKAKKSVTKRVANAARSAAKKTARAVKRIMPKKKKSRR